MLVRMRIFNIYVRHDIMWGFPFLWHPVTCNALCPIKSGPGGLYTSLSVGPCVRVWVTCGEVLHIQPYPKLERIKDHVTVFKDRSHHVMCMIALLTLILRLLIFFK